MVVESFITADFGQLNRAVRLGIETFEWCQATCQSVTFQWPPLSLRAFHFEVHCNVMRLRAEHRPLAITHSLEPFTQTGQHVFPFFHYRNHRKYTLSVDIVKWSAIISISTFSPLAVNVSPAQMAIISCLLQCNQCCQWLWRMGTHRPPLCWKLVVRKFLLCPHECVLCDPVLWGNRSW